MQAEPDHLSTEMVLIGITDNMAVSFQGRVGPIVQTVTRTIDNIIFDSNDSIEVSYVNYFFSSTEKSSSEVIVEYTDGLPLHTGPKSNSEFVAEYHHEKYVDEQKSSVIVESFNYMTGTFSSYEDRSASKKSFDFNRNIVLSNQSLLYTITGNDYKVGLQTVGDWEIRPFLQTASTKHLINNPFLDDPESKAPPWDGQVLLESGTSFGHRPIFFQGIAYNFPEPTEFISKTSKLIDENSNFSRHLESFNLLNQNFARSMHISNPTTHDVIEMKSGLYVMQPEMFNKSNTIYRSLGYGPPADKAVSISLTVSNPRDTFSKNNQFSKLLDNYSSKDDEFVEIVKNTTLNDVTWVDKIKVLNFEFSKTAYFERTNPLEVPVKVFYTPVLDKPFIHKVFFVNFDTGKPKFKPFLQSPDKTFLIEQNYMHSTVSIGKGPKNKFKHLMIEELYRPGFRSYEQVYEFIMEKFEVVSSTQFDYNKFGHTFYEVIQTKRPSLSGGSNAFGHDLLPIEVGPTSIKNKIFNLEEHVENSLQAAGRSGTHRDGEYREIQNIDLYEFQYLDYDVKSKGPYSEDWRLDKEKSTFNFIYTIDEDPSNGRLPECLSFDDGRLTGTVHETDKFLRKYSWEDWMKIQGETDSDGNFISLSDSLDFSYEDFELITPRKWEVNLTGRSITKGTIDLVYNGVELKRGDIITQTIAGQSSEFEIVEKVSEFDKETDRATGGLITETIHRYEFENLRGEIEITTLTDLFVETFVDGKSELQKEVNNLQEELQFSVNFKASVLQKQIEELSATIIENDLVNPTGYAYIEKTPSGKQVNYQYVLNEEGDSFVVDDLEMLTGGVVTKFIKLIFTIRNNWSFDRDLRLFTDSSIIDSEFPNRTDWVEDQRSKGRGLFDPQLNNNEIDKMLIGYMKEYKDSIISIERYLEERDIIIESRIYIDPDQKIKYKNFLDRFIYIDRKSNMWQKNDYLIMSITSEDFFLEFPINDGRDRGQSLDTISETENGKQVFKINCDFNVDEQTFYNNVDDVRELRGYPVYASCN